MVHYWVKAILGGQCAKGKIKATKRDVGIFTGKAWGGEIWREVEMEFDQEKANAVVALCSSICFQWIPANLAN